MAHKNKTNISPYKTRRLNQNEGPKKASGPAISAAAKNADKKLPAHLAKQGTSHKQPQNIYSVEEANDRLFDLFRNHDFSEIDHATRRRFAEFYVLLMENQKTENFTRLVTIKDIGLKHFIDCLMVPRLTKLQFPLLDLGTGPGFPGIPLRLALGPSSPIILAEGVQKRVEFLKQVRETMNLDPLPIIGRNINRFFAYPVNGVITRAVEDIPNTLRNVMTCLQTKGRVYFMKGPGVDPEIALAKKNLSDYYRVVEDHKYTLPRAPQAPRRLVVYEKYKQSPLPDFDEEPWPGESNQGGGSHAT